MTTDMAALREFYARYLAAHPGGGGWPSDAFANAVYAFACSSPLIPWASIETVLDVGCGTARLLSTLRERGFAGQYLGIDPLTDLYRLGAATLSETTQCLPFALDALGQTHALYDWVFALGTLGTDQPGKADYDREQLALMIEKTRLGLTLQVNDRRLMPPERLEQVPGLFAHDIPDLLSLLHALADPREMHVQRRYANLPSAVITVVR